MIITEIEKLHKENNAKINRENNLENLNNYFQELKKTYNDALEKLLIKILYTTNRFSSFDDETRAKSLQNNLSIIKKIMFIRSSKLINDNKGFSIEELKKKIIKYEKIYYEQIKIFILDLELINKSNL